MRKLVLFVLISSAIVCAQTPRAEVFGGYSFLHEPGANFNGWNGAATFNVYRCLGITAEFSGHYMSQSTNFPVLGVVRGQTRVYSYTFGPEVSYRNKTRLKPFVHLLFGGSHHSFKTTVGPIVQSDAVDRFTVIGGGGLDISVTRRIAIRPVQLEYHGVNFSGGWLNSARYSAGVVFRFGEK